MREHASRVVTVSATLAALLIGASFALADQPPTLGELALKEQERRKALKAAGRVLTKEDLPPAAAPAAKAEPAAKTESAAKVSRPRDSEPAANSEIAKDEAWWRQRMIQARDELRRNEIVRRSAPDADQRADERLREPRRSVSARAHR